MANYFNKLLLVVATFGAAFGVVRSEKGQDEPNTGLEITNVISVEISDGLKVTHEEVLVPEVIPPSDHLRQTSWLSGQILKCLEKQTESPNANVFYSAQIRYLKSQQLSIMRNPEKAQAETQAAIEAADAWYKGKKDMSFNNFRTAFELSDLKINTHPSISR